MPEQAAILYSRFMDSNFVKRLTQLMILDDEDDNDETTLDKTRFAMFKENKDPRRMYRPIQFLRALINNQTSVNTLNEASRWYLIQQLDIFEWRIPSIWYSINEHVKKKLDHPFKVVRDRMVIILSLSLRFDLTLFHGKPTRQPSIDQSIDEIRERLHQTIETYEKTSLVNMSDQLIEINSEVRQMLNFIETGRDVEFVANQYD
ncbi:unnamed protein product [Rotaria sordida]|uniref:Uncharacterized protein n=1 Tax=Rotaria sordida TaxID=392033 RepID=A0A815H5G4_9BILA|nr:unnamed protein product [Rotaria sordida]